VTEQRLIRWRGKVHARDEFFRNHEHINRRLRINIVNRDTQLVLMGQLRWNLSLNNFLKQVSWINFYSNNEKWFQFSGIRFFTGERRGSRELAVGTRQDKARDSVGQLGSIEINQ